MYEEFVKYVFVDDCWVVLYGRVYDFIDFLDDYFVGVDVIL